MQQSLFAPNLFILLSERQSLFQVAESSVTLFIAHTIILNVPALSPGDYHVFPGKHSRRIINRRKMITASIFFLTLFSRSPFALFHDNCLIIVFHNLATVRTLITHRLKNRLIILIIFPNNTTNLIIMRLIPDSPFKRLHLTAILTRHIIPSLVPKLIKPPYLRSLFDSRSRTKINLPGRRISIRTRNRKIFHRSFALDILTHTVKLINQNNLV